MINLPLQMERERVNDLVRDERAEESLFKSGLGSVWGWCLRPSEDLGSGLGSMMPKSCKLRE